MVRLTAWCLHGVGKRFGCRSGFRCLPAAVGLPLLAVKRPAKHNAAVMQLMIAESQLHIFRSAPPSMLTICAISVSQPSSQIHWQSTATPLLLQSTSPSRQGMDCDSMAAVTKDKPGVTVSCSGLMLVPFISAYSV